MEYRHIQKNIQSSPRKLRLVADMVRSMSPLRALETLQFAPQAAAQPLAKAIKTALANAGRDDVVIKSLEINEGMKLKRYHPGTAGRGRGRPYKKRWSHIKVVLTDEVSQVPQVSRVPRGENEVKSQNTKVKNTDQNLKVEDKKEVKQEKEMEAKELKAEEVKEEVAEAVEEKIEEKVEDERLEKEETKK